MVASEKLTSEKMQLTQESTHRQAFHPILATLFFAAITAPMVLGWGGYESSSQASMDLTRSEGSGAPVVIAKCDLPEHNQAGHRCRCRRS